MNNDYYEYDRLKNLMYKTVLIKKKPNYKLLFS